VWGRKTRPGTWVVRWARIHTVALLAILTGEAVAILELGAPGWLAVLAMTGIVIAIGGVRLGGRSALSESPEKLDSSSVPAVSPSPERREGRAVGYVRVTRDGLGSELRAHSAAIRAWSEERGVQVVAIVHDVEPAAGDSGARPALCGLLERMSADGAETLVVAELEHISSTAAKLPRLLRWFSANNRRLVAIDLGLDTATEAGQQVALALASVGGWEHERISARTRRGMEAARARGSGVGRAAIDDVPELRDRIARMRESGMTLQAIADVLNEEGVPTLRGGAMWRPSTVHRATGYRRPPSARPDVYPPRSDLQDDGANPAV
jgi:DNA invertase Pin-like site-specific DNA recombinase